MADTVNDDDEQIAETGGQQEEATSAGKLYTTSAFVLPGTQLGHADDFRAGPGTYYRFRHVHASLAGYQRLLVPDDPSQLPTISVSRDQTSQVRVPKIGDAVTCRVVRVSPRFASVEILCVGDHPMRDQYNGVIRVQDVRATEIDKVEIYQSFRPGDIVRAEVISLGTTQSYFLSTAKNQYGVIWAKSVAGEPMVPISWDTMQCPKSRTREHRKVARQIDPVQLQS